MPDIRADNFNIRYPAGYKNGRISVFIDIICTWKNFSILAFLIFISILYFENIIHNSLQFCDKTSSFVLLRIKGYIVSLWIQQNLWFRNHNYEWKIYIRFGLSFLDKLWFLEPEILLFVIFETQNSPGLFFLFSA